MKYLTPLTWAAICAPLTAATVYVETFTTDTAGWQHISNGTSSTLNHDLPSGVLTASVSDFTSFFAFADATASGGAFSGDLVTAGITGFRFDLNIDPTSTVTDLHFELTNLTNSETWVYNLALPTLGNTATIHVPLDETNWTQNSGSQPFSYIVGNVEEVAISFGGNGSGTLTASIDNVETIPEPTALTMLIGASFLLAGRRQRKA